jgi:phage tail-like protein
MEGDRGVSVLAHPDQWARCRHEGSALLPDGGVQLTWEEPPPVPPAPCATAGLAFDRWCRAYRSHPAQGGVTVHGSGGGALDEGCTGLLACPLGLGVDAAQRLYVAESGAGRVAVADLWSRRLLRRVSVRSRTHRSRQPIDVAVHCCHALVLLRRPAGIVVVRSRRGPFPGPALRRPRCRGPLQPCRLAVRPDGTPLVLWRGPDGTPAYVTTADGEVLVQADGATDLDVDADGTLVVAREPGRAFRRLRPEAGGWLELEPVEAAGYDGGAVAVAPDGAVAFTTAGGVGRTGGPAVRRATRGRVVTYRLDAQAYRTRWGRVFLDACIPAGTDVRLGFVSSDEDTVADPVDWQPAARGTRRVARPDLTPPLPSARDLADLPDDPGAGQGLFRRATGRERPWAQIPTGDRYETYEAPVSAAPGRYLWIVLTLTGTRTTSPRVRSLRVERPGHSLLHQLPRSWSRDDGDAGFLQRFLAPAEGLLHELDERAATRALLVDPTATPQEALAWLASFAGLVLDRRWSETARRTLVAEAWKLFRRRGTLAMVIRMLEIYLGYPPVIVEQWRLRGIPGGTLGSGPGDRAPVLLGGGMRVGGEPGDKPSAADGYATAAHRFSVLIPADLSSEQLAVVRSVLDTQRPAHTLYEVCELGFGMRAGRRLHLGLTSVVGPGAGWAPALVGRVAVGGDGVVGVAGVGTRVGETSVAGSVRVG